jgi:hypothetical protein
MVHEVADFPRSQVEAAPAESVPVRSVLDDFLRLIPCLRNRSFMRLLVFVRFGRRVGASHEITSEKEVAARTVPPRSRLCRCGRLDHLHWPDRAGNRLSAIAMMETQLNHSQEKNDLASIQKPPSLIIRRDGQNDWLVSLPPIKRIGKRAYSSASRCPATGSSRCMGGIE